MLEINIKISDNRDMAIKVKRRTDITHFSQGALPSIEFPLDQDLFEVSMATYQVLSEHFMPFCEKCNKSFEAYPDFVGHKHDSKKETK